MSKLQRQRGTREEEISSCMQLLKSYSEQNPNDITGLLSGMAKFLHAFSAFSPFSDFSKHLLTLRKLLEQFPYDVNEHSKAIETFSTLFVLSMESAIEREQNNHTPGKVNIEEKGRKEWEFVPSQTRQHRLCFISSRDHEYYRPCQSKIGETWEENTVDMDDFDVNQAHSSMDKRDKDWKEEKVEMPSLVEEDQEKYCEGLRGKAENGRTDKSMKKGRSCSFSSKNLMCFGRLDRRFQATSQRRVISNTNELVMVPVIRKGIALSPSKNILKSVELLPKREGASIGMGKANISLENHLLTKICPKSATLKHGFCNKGSSFISRSRARTSGLLKHREENAVREDVIEGTKRAPLEETVVESRMKEDRKELHDGRLTRNLNEATVNTNLSEAWWALDARKNGASLLNNRLKRVGDEKMGRRKEAV